MKLFKFGADFLHPEFKKFVFGAGAEFAKATIAAAPPATSGTGPAGGSRQ